jgi:putative transposase
MHLREKRGASQRRACPLVGQHRSTQRYATGVPDDEPRLMEDMQRLARRHPRYGYRRIHQLLLREGWRLNHKRVQRLWRREGMRVPLKRRKRRSLGTSANSCTRRRAERKDHVWTYDFMFDRTEDGRQLKILTVVDEFTRESLCVHVDRSITGVGVIEQLSAVMAKRGTPDHIRSDNGPEFIAVAVRRWLHALGSSTLFVEPGAPWENAYAETFNGKFRDELLNGELFVGLDEARYLAERFRQEYNTHRPHSSLGYRTPAEFAASCAPSGTATLRLRERSSRGATPLMTETPSS